MIVYCLRLVVRKVGRIWFLRGLARVWKSWMPSEVVVVSWKPLEDRKSAMQNMESNYVTL